MREKKKNYVLHKTVFIITIFMLGYITTVCAQEFNRYCNTRFGFCVIYPIALKVSPAPDNDDGRKFYDHNGFSMTASGMYNVLENSLKSEMKSQEEDFDTVTYRKIKNNWYVLSGYKGNDILYIKTYMGKEIIYHLYMRYPVKLKKKYDKTVSKVSGSFKPDS